MRTAFEQIWEKGGFGAWVLSPLSALYGLGWLSYLGIYRLGLKQAKQPHSPIVCIGNLVAGGSGKTPLTLAVADLLVAAGREVVVSTSGYGSPRQHEATLAPAGSLDVEEWGDEATMMRWLRPDLRLVVGRNRVLAAEIVAADAPGAVMLMDDGFQHLPLEKNVTVVVDVDGANKFCFPAGPLREPRRVGLSRADRVVRASVDFTGRIERFQDQNGEAVDLVGEVDALCAIANPERFLSSLREFGLTVRDSKALTDHDSMQGAGVLGDFGTERPVVVTAKDFVKLKKWQDLSGRHVVVADYEVQLAEPERFLSWLLERIDESVS